MIDSKVKYALMIGVLGVSMVFEAKAATPASVKLAWDPSPEANVTGYRVHYGTTRGAYNKTLDAGGSAMASVNDLAPGATYYFVVTAYNNLGVESAPSQEIAHVPGSSSSLQLSSLPQSQVATRGSTVRLSVGATGSEPLAYQWNKGGVAIPGATQSVFTINNMGPAGIGAYSVTVRDSSNSSTSTPTVAVSTMQIQKPREILLNGIPGAKFAIAYSENLASNVWAQLGTVGLVSNQVQWVDSSATNSQARFYQVTPVE